MAGVLNSILNDGREDRPNYLTKWDYEQLCTILERLVAEGRVRRVSAFNPLHSGNDEQWYLDVETGEIYSLLPISERVNPIWEKVDVYDTRTWKQKQVDWQKSMGAEERPVGYLAQMHTGRLNSAEVYYLNDVLQAGIKDGKVRSVDVTESLLTQGIKKKYFRDLATQETYELIHDEINQEFRWQRVPTSKSC